MQKEEVHALKKTCEVLKDKLVSMEREAPELQFQLDVERKKLSEVSHPF